jgi:hypothetical protein
MIKSSVSLPSVWGVITTETCSSTVSGSVLDTLNYIQVNPAGLHAKSSATHLEYHVFFEKVLDARNLILSLALCQL